jgi:tryptophan 2,3-dioxygenase
MKREYASYIRLDELLELQNPRTGRLPAELAFIVVHQVYELWFKLIIADIESVTLHIDSGELIDALKGMHRIHSVERLIIEQLVLLEQIDPLEFADIRRSLGTASAAQSEQFALIEKLSSSESAGSSTIGSRGLWSAFCEMAEEYMNLRMPTDASESSNQMRQASLYRIYVDTESRNDAVRELCEALLDHDENFALWRYRHYMTAYRQIGRSPGTGGTAGIAYLEKRLSRRFYPELWEVRTLWTTNQGNGSHISAIESAAKFESSAK